MKKNRVDKAVDNAVDNAVTNCCIFFVFGSVLGGHFFSAGMYFEFLLFQLTLTVLISLVMSPEIRGMLPQKKVPLMTVDQEIENASQEHNLTKIQEDSFSYNLDRDPLAIEIDRALRAKQERTKRPRRIHKMYRHEFSNLNQNSAK